MLSASALMKAPAFAGEPLFRAFWREQGFSRFSLFAALGFSDTASAAELELMTTRPGEGEETVYS